MKKLIVLAVFLSATVLFAKDDSIGTCFIKGTKTIVPVTGYNCTNNYLELWFYSKTNPSNALETCPSSVTISSTVIPFVGANLTPEASKGYKNTEFDGYYHPLCFYSNVKAKQSLACTLELNCGPKE